MERVDNNERAVRCLNCQSENLRRETLQETLILGDDDTLSMSVDRVTCENCGKRNPDPLTADTIAVLWKMSEENWTQSRHHESQRSALSNMVLLSEAALLGFIANSIKKGEPIDWMMPTFLFALGVFGMVAVLKLYERSKYYFHIASAQSKCIALLSDPMVAAVRKFGRDHHKKRLYTKLVENTIRIYVIWIVLHLVVAALGAILFARSVGWII